LFLSVHHHTGFDPKTNMKSKTALAVGVSAILGMSANLTASPNDRTQALSVCPVTLGLVLTSPAATLPGGTNNRDQKVVYQLLTKGEQGVTAYSESRKIQAVKASTKVSNAVVIEAAKKALGLTGNYRLIAVPTFTGDTLADFNDDQVVDATVATSNPWDKFNMSYDIFLDEISNQNPTKLGVLSVGPALTYSLTGSWSEDKTQVLQSDSGSGSINYDNGGVNFAVDTTFANAFDPAQNPNMDPDAATNAKEKASREAAIAVLGGLSRIGGTFTGSATYVRWANDSEKMKINQQETVYSNGGKLVGSGAPSNMVSANARMTGTISIGKQSVTYSPK
jgi:hypothetical protein